MPARVLSQILSLSISSESVVGRNGFDCAKLKYLREKIVIFVAYYLVPLILIIYLVILFTE